MTSLCRRRCHPISSALWGRARSRFTPLGRRRWSARRGHGPSRARQRHVVAPCRPHRGAAPQLRLVVGRYAATAARYAARRLVPRSGTTSWPRRGAATRHRYGIPVQSFFMKPSSVAAPSLGFVPAPFRGGCFVEQVQQPLGYYTDRYSTVPAQSAGAHRPPSPPVS